MKDSSVIDERCETEALSKLREFFDERIDQMSPRQLSRFERKASKIVKKAQDRAKRDGVLH